jgi:hypothetical protein
MSKLTEQLDWLVELSAVVVLAAGATLSMIQ